MNETFCNIEYEKALLGCMLLDNDIIDDVKTKISSECFFNPKAKLIFETIISQYSQDKCSDILTVSSVLKNINTASIASLTDTVVNSSNWEVYANKIRSLYLSRKMQSEVSTVISNLNGDNPGDIITELNSKLSGYMQTEGTDAFTAKNLCVDIPQKIYNTYQSLKDGNMLLGYDTGFEQLNEITDGFQTKQLYVIGARPSIGKTAFGMNLVSNFCKKKIPTAVFSLEMTAEKLFYRMTAKESSLQINHIEKGFCLSSKVGIGKFQNAMERIFEYPLNIYDSGIDNDSVLYSKIRYEAKVNGTKVFLIDHLGLIECANSTGQRYIDVGKITKTLHKMVKELNICIILLCQCAREAEGKEPTLALLRESGNIEQDGDVIMFLYRERDMNETNVPTDIIVAKNRDGKIGKANMIFQLPYSRFVEADNEGNYKQYKEEPKQVTETPVRKDYGNALF